eukprot:6197173-Pleurochrysis_carterae.AAC.1
MSPPWLIIFWPRLICASSLGCVTLLSLRIPAVAAQRFPLLVLSTRKIKTARTAEQSEKEDIGPSCYASSWLMLTSHSLTNAPLTDPACALCPFSSGSSSDMDSVQNKAVKHLYGALLNQARVDRAHATQTRS